MRAPAQQFSVSPSSVNVDPQGVTGSQIQVTGDSSLAWTAGDNQPWLTITSGSSGQGNGTILFDVEPTPTAVSRMATITITSTQGTRSVPVTQSGGNLVVSPSSANVPAQPAQRGTVTVTASSNALQWTVTSDQNWLEFQGSASRTGSDTVTWDTSVNSSCTARIATLTMTPAGGNGQTFVVTQQARSNCSDLTISKTHSGTFQRGGVGTFSVTVSNPGSTPTSGVVTVSDTLPTGLTATAASGTGWTCSVGSTVTCTRSDVLAAGGSYPPITLTVNVAANAAASVTNTATVSGGGDANDGNNSASDTVTISALPDLSITKSHAGTFSAGQTASYTIVVSNAAGAAPTTGTVTVSDTLPTGLTATAATGTGWTCTVGATVTCTRRDALAAGASYPPITLTVNVAANAPASVTNTARVTGGGDTTPANNSASDPTTITSIPDLSITKSHTGSFTAGQTGSYTIVVSNAAGAGPTTGTVTVSDTLPTGLTATAATGAGWTCTVAATVTCTRSDVLAAGASYPPITLTVNVSASAAASITNTAAVSGGGDQTPANNTATDPTSIISAQSDLSLTKLHSGTFIPGQTGTYVLSVSNAAGAGVSTGTVTVSDTLPTGLTATAATGPGWTCTVGPTVTCTRSDALAPGGTYPPITIAVNVAASAPPSVTNTATVAGGGDGNPANNTASDTTSVPSLPDLSITKSHTGNFVAGQTGTYTLVVTNDANAGPTAGGVTVTDTLPAGLTATAATGSGWTCTVGATVTCTRGDALAPGASYPPITLTVNVAANAPASVTNTATVTGGGDTTPANNSASDPTSIGAVASDLSLVKVHSGGFIPGQTGTYILSVSNAGAAGASSGAVTVSDTLPDGLTASAAVGDGWTCTVGSTVTCTRSDALAPGNSYPPITITVNVATGAPPSVTNTATVTGGGDTNPANNSASDTTSIPATSADLSIAKSHTGNFAGGQTGVYTIVVSNAGGVGPTGGPVTVTDTLPAGLTATDAAGDGWNCTVGPTVSCTRSDVLSPGASYPPITLTVNVASNASTSVINTATVTGGGDTTPANNSASDPTSIAGLSPDLSLMKLHSGGFAPGQTGTYTLVVSNAAGGGPTIGDVTVSDTLPAGLTATAATGTGWTCTVGSTVTCSRSDALAPGNSYPPITITVNVATTAPSTVTNTATVAGGGDANLNNNTATDTATIPAQPPDLSITKAHVGNFVSGQSGSYTILVSNAPGAGPTTGPVTVSDVIPSGLTATAAAGDGWSCTIGPTVGCTRGDVLAPGASYSPITVSVNVAPGAPATVTNTAIVEGGGDASPANNSASDQTSIGQPADLSITKSRTTELIPGQSGAYTIVVSNAAGAGPTTGMVTVTDTMPPGLTAVSASGPGWTCTVGATVTCTRSDVLAPGTSYPPITLTVNIATDAAATIINVATVSGGGDASPGNNSGSDSGTPVTNTCLSITQTISANFVANTGQVIVTVSNPGPVASSGRVVVLGSPPLFAPPISASGAGWDCGILAHGVSCTRTDSLAPGAQFPPITVIADLANAGPASTGNATFYVGNATCVRPVSDPAQLPAVVPRGPEISLVTNSASFVTPGQPNYAIAPGSLATIFGTLIGPATPAEAKSLPLDPSGFAGVNVKATVGDTTVDVPVVFASASQLNVMLPSSTPLGDGVFVATFNGQATAPFPIRVVRTALGIFTPNRQGFGPGVAQNAFPGGIVEQNSLITPVAPGQIVELWATGLGPVQGAEFAMPLPGQLDVPVEIYAGGQRVQPIYAGRSGCCVGTDQIHFVVPETLQGCYVPVFVKAGGVVSNTVTLSVASSELCADPGALTPRELERLKIREALIEGTISLNRTILPDNTNQDYALETYRNLNLFSLLITEPDFPVPPVGSCTVGQSRRDGQGMAPPAPLYVPADALAVFPFREKPNAYMSAGSPQVTQESDTRPLVADSFLRYSALLGQSPSTFLDPGLVTASNERTVAPLGLVPQSVMVPAAPQVLGWQQGGASNPSTIDRAAPLTVQWSGGDPANDLGLIAGFKTIASLSGGRQGTTATSWFVCTAPIEAGTYTVPAEVLQAMPTGLPVAGPSGEQLPWLPGGSLNEITTQKSSLAIGSIRKPEASRFQTLGVDFGRLTYVLVTKREVNYR